MKKLQKKALVWLLTLAMLVPVLSAAMVPAIAATTEGELGNLQPGQFDGLMAPAEYGTVNMENNGGIRFATNINLAKYEELKAFCEDRWIREYTIGTLIAPLDYVLEAGQFNREKLDALGYKNAYLNIEANTEIFYQGEKTLADGYDAQFVASIMSIKLDNRTRDFAAIGYIELQLTSGTFTIYSYDNEDMALVTKYATNLAEVAERELQKDDLTNEERAMLTDLAAAEQPLQIDSANIQDVRTKRNQVFFTYVTGSKKLYNRLTYDGANGWRLQTNKVDYNHFKDISAGQSLAMYLGEGFRDVTMPLSVTDEGNRLIITAAGTDTYATLAYDTFNLDFCSESGESLYNINAINLMSTGKLKIGGRMTADEAVYGGGETFGSANKRGQTLNLYISDAYNANGTYVAVPLFSTSRGGGMFINRYEPITVGFPASGHAGDWSLLVDGDIIDAYFYATGEISDVLQAYTNLTGHASLPEEWAQGYLVCRYAPDFNSVTDMNGGTDGVYWCAELPNPELYKYTPHLLLTAEAAAKLGNNAPIQSKDGKTTYYTFIQDASNRDSDGNGRYGDSYFRTENQLEVKYYYSYAELPNKEECYYDNQTKVSVAENSDALCHKKTVSYGASSYHYIIESDTEDFNYNGITGETYFLRVGSRGGPGGAGVTYIVESLIDAGMKPTGVILEGANWYDAGTSSLTRTKLKTFITYLNEQNIKVLVYTSLGHVLSTMDRDYDSSYLLRYEIYKYDSKTGIGDRITGGINIPKSDDTDNPDTTSGGTQVYLDISNPKAVEWYMNSVWGRMMDLGIDGIKIDFCESVPNEGVYSKLKIGDTVYENVYLKLRWYDPTMFDGKEAHHAYPSYFVSMFYKSMEEKAAQRDGDTGFVVLTRGGGIGAQRNPYFWAGDQERRFRSLATQLSAVINSGISGIPFMTYDMGGYAYAGSAYHYYGGQLATIDDIKGSVYLADQQAAEEYESEIFVRALQFTVFGNMIQTHGYVRHVYQMTEEAQEIAALYSALHEELADYLQKLSKIACDTGMPMVRHMILEYQNDANVANINDQFMYGDALLLAPILTCNVEKNEMGKTVLDYASTVTRTVYLPAGTWIDLNTGETIVSTGMEIEVSANLAKIPAYLNTASADAAELQQIFAGETWNQIKALANAQ